MNIRQIFWLDKALDLVWPRFCDVCGKPSDRPRRYVCSSCLNRLPFVPLSGCCRKCGRDAVGLDDDFLCQECRELRPSFDRVASAVRFDGEARELINSFKFRNRLWLRDDLVDWLEAAAMSRFHLGNVDLVLPMPLTLWRRLDRGYNQCSYLAKSLADRLGMRYDWRVLKRTGSPVRQSSLSEDERRKNVVGTFAVRKPEAVKGKTVLVVDDIMTTGSTLSECAAELKRAGADRVWGLTLARTPRT